METTGAEEKIKFSSEAYERLKQNFVLQKRCRINVKGKGGCRSDFYSSDIYRRCHRGVCNQAAYGENSAWKCSNAVLGIGPLEQLFEQRVRKRLSLALPRDAGVFAKASD